MYQQRKLTRDRDWETPHGRDFRPQDEYEPLHFRDFSKSPFFQNPLLQTEKIQSGMHVTPEPAKILKLNVEGLKKEENHSFILKAEKLKVKEVEIYKKSKI